MLEYALGMQHNNPTAARQSMCVRASTYLMLTRDKTFAWSSARAARQGERSSRACLRPSTSAVAVGSGQAARLLAANWSAKDHV